MNPYLILRSLLIYLIAYCHIDIVKCTDVSGNDDPGTHTDGSDQGTDSQEHTNPSNLLNSNQDDTSLPVLSTDSVFVASTPLSVQAPEAEGSTLNLDDGTGLSTSKFKVVTADDDLGTNSVENDDTKYNLYTLPKSDTLLYSFKPDSKCVEVKYEAHSLWKYSRDDLEGFPKSVSFNYNNKVVHVKFDVYFHTFKFGNNEWTLNDQLTFKPVPLDKSKHPSDLKVLTLDELDGTVLKEDDFTQFRLFKMSNSQTLLYHFNSGSKCVEFKNSDKTVWKHDSSERQTEYPKSISFDPVEDSVVVKFDKFHYTFKLENNNWVLDKDLPSRPDSVSEFVTDLDRPFTFEGLEEQTSDRMVSEVSPTLFVSSDFKVVTADDYELTNSMENDLNKYTLRKHLFGFTFVFRDDAKCVELKYKYQTVWKHDFDQQGYRFPKTVYCNTSTNKLFVVFNEKWFYGYEYRNSTWELESGLSESVKVLPGSELWPADFEVVTAEDINGTNPKVNDMNKFQLFRYPNSYAFIYVFEDLVKCVELRYKGKTLWKYDPSLNKLPKSVYFKTTDRSLIVYFKDDTFYTYEISEEEAKSQSETVVSQVLTQTESRKISSSNVKILTLSDYSATETKENDKTKYELFKFAESDTLLYSFYDNARCVEFKHGDQTVWRHDSNEHSDHFPRSIYFNEVKEAVLVQFYDKWYYTYQFFDGMWNFNPSLSQKVSTKENVIDLMVDLDVSVKKTTHQYKYSKDSNDVETYTAKNSLLFKKATKGSNTVWEAQNNKYANKVTVTKGADGNLSVKVDYPSGGTPSTPDGGSSQSGGQVTPSHGSTPTTPNADGSQSGDGSSATPKLDPSSVSEDQSSGLSGTPSDQSTPDADQQNKSETPTSGDGSTPTPSGSEEGTSSAPDAGADQSSSAEDSSSTTPPAESAKSTPKTASEPSSPDSAKQDKSGTHKDGDGSQLPDGSTPTTPDGQNKSGGTPTTPNGGSSQSENNLIELDLDKKESTDQYEYSTSDDSETYDAKLGFKFKSVRNGNLVLWQSKDFAKSHKVVVTDPDKKNYVAFIFVESKLWKFYLEREKKDDELKPKEQQDVSEGEPTETEKIEEKPDLELVVIDESDFVEQKEEPLLDLSHLKGLTLPKLPGHYTSVFTPTKPKESIPEFHEEQAPVFEFPICLSRPALVEPDHPRDFKVVTFDDQNVLKENDVNSYTVYRFPRDTFLYVLNDGSRCAGLKHGDKSVWNHSDYDVDQFPKSVSFRDTDKTVTVNFDDHFYVFKFENGEWKLDENLSFKPVLLDKSKHPSSVTVVTLDQPVSPEDDKTHKLGEAEPGSHSEDSSSDDTPKTEGSSKLGGFKENDDSKYRVFSHPLGAFLYKFSDGVKCSEFKYENKTVWKFSSRSFNKFPSKIFFYEDKKMVFVEFYPFYDTYKLLDNEWKNSGLSFKPYFRQNLGENVQSEDHKTKEDDSLGSESVSYCLLGLQ